MVLFGSLVSAAHAFCGTYVGSPGSSLVNRTSQVVLARQGTTTTLTLMADYAGDLADFALLIPVPESLDPNGVRTLDPSVVDRLDQYSTPRLVQYTCDTALSTTHSYGCGPAPAWYVGGCASASDFGTGFYGNYTGDISLSAAAGTVTVEAAFRLAEYDVVLLGAEGADGLYTWLADNGFAVPAGGEEVLQDYIDDGVHFLAAKVHLDELPDGEVSRLSPLQLRYEADTWELPIRIGTISAQDEQEVIIYAITDVTAGDVQITNFPERTVEDECMWPASKWDDFGTFYQDRLHVAMRGEFPEETPETPTPFPTTPTDAEDPELGWVTEYNWTLYKLTQDTGYHCDPCTVEVEQLYDPGELQELGFVDNGPPNGYGSTPTTWSYDPYEPVTGGALLTRLRLVYDPLQVVDDLALATTGMHPENKQIRYIEYDRQLEFLFPTCGEGFAEEPGMCGDEDPVQQGGGSSLPVPPAAIGAGLLALAALRRRLA